MDRRLTNRMWLEACEILTRAERLHRQFFQPLPTGGKPAWEPPVDVLETDAAVMVLIALPGVEPGLVQAAIEDRTLHIAGIRVLPPAWRNAVFHRLELPQGRFERRIPLPAGLYRDVRCASVDGCLVITLDKTGGSDE